METRNLAGGTVVEVAGRTARIDGAVALQSGRDGQESRKEENKQ